MSEKNNKKYTGIDIGLSGNIAVIGGEKILEMYNMPVLSVSKTKKEYDVQGIVEILSKHKDSVMILEKTQALPKLGTVQSHHLGKGYGIMIGILAALNIRHHVIHPKTWQSKILRDTPGEETKTKSALVAQRLFPSFRFIRTEKSKKIDHNMCDAALLAFYGQNYLYEKTN